MKGGKTPLGYTIVEVMIVLAVSGMMFVIAASFISGKQARTAFTAGSNEFNTQMQTVISQVVDGQYSDINFGCSVSNNYKVITISTTGTQGANPQCVFIGKMIGFSDGGDDTKYAVYSMAASRIQTSPNYTVAIKSGTTVDLTAHQQVPQGLRVSSVKVYTGGAPITTAQGVGFAQSTGTFVAGGGYSTGSQTVGLYYTMDLLTSSNVKLVPATSATICLTDDTRNVVIELGDNVNKGNQLSANVQVVTTCP